MELQQESLRLGLHFQLILFINIILYVKCRNIFCTKFDSRRFVCIPINKFRDKFINIPGNFNSLSLFNIVEKTCRFENSQIMSYLHNTAMRMGLILPPIRFLLFYWQRGCYVGITLYFHRRSVAVHGGSGLISVFISVDLKMQSTRQESSIKEFNIIQLLLLFYTYSYLASF